MQKNPNFALVFIMSNMFVLLSLFISPDPGEGFWKASTPRSHAKLLKVKIRIGFGFRLTSSKS